MATDGRGKLVGIDLGTTYSVIAQLDAQGNVATLSNREGAPLTPSVVYLDGSTALVGEAAKKAAASQPGKVAMFVKRDIGKQFYEREIGGRRFFPETLSAIILRKLKQDAEKRIGPIDKAVITVPAFFDDSRRKATQDAGRIAGLEVLDIINEPTAAALAYALEGKGGKVGGFTGNDFPDGRMTALIYDLGGGTFDVTVVRLAAKHFETLATDGAVELGGKDWDDKIVNHVAGEFKQRFGLDPRDDPQRRDALAEAAEQAKLLLSDLPAATVTCSYRGHELSLQLTREQFEALSRDKLIETQLVTQLVAEQAKVGWTDVNRVLLVGGSTKMPMVKNMLRGLTGKEPDDSLDPDQVVARGAAIHAGIVAAKSAYGKLELDEDVRSDLEEQVVFNVNAYSLGVEALRIPKNTQLPHAASKIYRLHQAGATAVAVRVLEGEATAAAHNILIGTCLVKNLPANLPAKAPIQVRLAYSPNGRINVMALDMTSGGYAEAELQREKGLTEEQIQRETAYVNSLTIR